MIARFRDPFLPLWDLNPAQRPVLSLDWIKDLRTVNFINLPFRCLVISLDDGTMRILSLTKAANDVPVTGGPFAGPKYQGLHGFTCSAFAIWSVQVSQTTEEGHVLNINSSLPNIPLRNVPVSLKKVPGPGYLFDAGRPKEANSTDLGDNRAMVKKLNNSQAPPVESSNSKLRKILGPFLPLAHNRTLVLHIVRQPINKVLSPTLTMLGAKGQEKTSRKMEERGYHTTTYVLVKWSDLPEDKATWEDYYFSNRSFRPSTLENKGHSQVKGIVMNM
uniref:Uncharacterized protein n=1 Tax=Ananas comosus var. bracteatus TaxID=296719 RepID=A0A6V7NEY3_ANACO|nr:unnamed protein product [Ananas comosus var. bracteatus]